MLKLLIMFVLACSATSQQVTHDTDRPFLRILAPKFICNDQKKQVEQSSNITIGLQTREGQKLRYQISIDFEMLDGFKSQQHTLSIWKNVRMLQKKFSSLTDEISLKNQIEINAQELTPQVVYTFMITGVDEKNISSEVQNFSMTYKGGELKAVQDNLGDGVSLLLFSSEFFYDDMELLAVAEVSFCKPINDYSYRWKVAGLEASEIESVTSNSLKLLPGMLKAGAQLQVTVTVVNSESLIMATVTLPVNIVAKEFQLQNAPLQCSVGPGREVPFQAMIYRQPNSEIQSISWSCSQDCSESFTNSSVLNQLVTFSKEGSFELQSMVTINQVTKLSTTKVAVDIEVIPLVQIKYLPSQPLNVMKANEVVVTVLNLIPKCFAYWNIMAGEGFAAFKTGVDGNFTDMGYTVIKNFEEYFLQELVDYDNSTLSKDVTLSLLAECLKPNVNYKFRLTITCPEPLREGENQAQRTNVTSFYEIIVNTNGPPETLPLIVNPINSVPMKQRFKFTTGAAKDTTIDFPLKYTFGYIVNNLTVVIGSYYENMVAHTQLPFSDEIETFCDVCDNNGACVKLSGPVVSATMAYNFSSDDFDFKLAEFEATLRRNEYSESLNTAVVLIMTHRKVKGDSPSLESKMMLMMEKEIEKLKSSDESSFLYQQRIVEFVKMSKNLMNIMAVSNEKFVEDLLTLTETISRSAKKIKRAIITPSTTINVVNHDSEYIKNVLSLSEILLNSNNSSVVQREKGKCVEKVHRFVSSMCIDKNVNSQSIESKFSSFEVVKVFSPQLSIDPQILPGSEKSTIVFSITGNLSPKYVCVAKIRFSIDMFTSESTEMSSPVYETIILDENLSGTFELVKVSDLTTSVTIDLAATTTSGTASLTCFIRKGENWSSDECIKQNSNVTGRVVCKCKTAGLESVTLKLDKRKNIKPTVSSEIVVNNFGLTEKIEQTSQFTFLSTQTGSTTPAFTSFSSRTTALNIIETRVTSVAYLTPAGTSSPVVSGVMSSGSVTERTTLSSVVQQEPSFTKPVTNGQPLRSTAGVVSTQVTQANSLAISGINAAVTTLLPRDQEATTISPDKQDLPSKPGQPGITSSISTSNQLDPKIPTNSFNQSGSQQQPNGGKTTLKSTGANAQTSATTSSGQGVTLPSVEKVTINTVALNSSSQNLQTANDSSVSWTLIILLLIFFLIILILFAAHRCRHFVDLNANLPMRNRSSGIKYAKYHDEFTMRG